MKKSEIGSKQTPDKEALSPKATSPLKKQGQALPERMASRTTLRSSRLPVKQQSGTSKATDKTPLAKDGLRGLFVHQLQDIYWAEKALHKTWPDMISKASSRELTDALNQQLNRTQKQIARCEDAFQRLHVSVTPHKSNAMEGLIRDANEVIDSTTPGSVRDAGIICAAQKVDHFKIATYGTLTAFADQIGEKETAMLLKESLQEEKQADQRLTQVAQYTVNEAAATM